jgi:hypothetical protein
MVIVLCFCVRQDFEESSNCQGDFCDQSSFDVKYSFFGVFFCQGEMHMGWNAHGFQSFFLQICEVGWLATNLSMLLCPCDYFFWGRWI